MLLSLSPSSKPRKARRQRVQSTLSDLVATTHGEDGCLRYALHRDRNDSTRFLLVEQWTNQDALEAHFGQPHFTPLLEMAADAVSQPGADVHLREPPRRGPGQGLL